MVVVVLGALTATAVVGVSTLTGDDNTKVLSANRNVNSGSRASSARTTSSTGGGNGIARNACRASADAAGSASTLYFASRGSYPVKWSDLTASNPPMYKLATNVVVNAGNPTELDGDGWKLTMAGGGVREPTFTCT